MIKLGLLVFVFSIIVTGYSEEVANSLAESSSDNSNTATTTKQLWLEQFKGVRRSGKPCARRSNSNPDGTWIKSYSSKTIHPIYDSKTLQSQALKNEEQGQDQTGIPTKTHLQVGSIRRSTDDSGNPDDDCDDQLDASHAGPGHDISAAALKMIEDCLKKKHAHLDNALEASSHIYHENNNHALEVPGHISHENYIYPLESSRRSMSDPEPNVDDNLILLRDPSIDELLERHHLDGDSNRRYGGTKNIYNNDQQQQQQQQQDQQIIDQQQIQQQQQQDQQIIDEQQVQQQQLQNSGSNLQHLRICYACSTATNPTCWEPDKRTTIKYCRKEQSCVTKTFGVKNQLTLIRDCANSCADTSVPGLEPKYKSCKVCHKDYCNSAMGVSINFYSLGVILIVTVIKCAY